MWNSQELRLPRSQTQSALNIGRKKELALQKDNDEETGRYFRNPVLLEVDLSTDPNQVKQIFTYDCDNWYSVLLSITGRSFPWRPLSIVMFISLMYVLVDTKYEIMIFGDIFDKDMNPQVHGTFGIVLGFLIVYQTSQSNARWWEGRCAWENIITHSREAMRILCSHCNGKEIIKLFGRYQMAFSVCVQHYLIRRAHTKDNPCPELAKILEPDDLRRLYMLPLRSRPLACIYACQRIVEISIRNELFGRPVARDINPRLVTLAANLGACERILYTPMPWVYTLHLRMFMLLYLAYLPFALSYYKPVPSPAAILFYSLVLSYAYLGLEDMAVQIQNPFGDSCSDLPITIFLQLLQDDVEEIVRLKYEQYNNEFTDKLELGVFNSEIRLTLPGMENKRFYPFTPLEK